MSELGARLIHGLSDLRENIANDIGATARVECRMCGSKHKTNTARCLREGWPTCCGETMRLVTLDQQEWTEDGDN